MGKTQPTDTKEFKQQAVHFPSNTSKIAVAMIETMRAGASGRNANGIMGGMARSVRFLAESAIGALFTVSYSISREMVGPEPAIHLRKETQKGKGGREP